MGFESCRPELAEATMQFPDKVCGMVSHIDYSPKDAVTVNARKRPTSQGENSKAIHRLSC